MQASPIRFRLTLLAGLAVSLVACSNMLPSNVPPDSERPHPAVERDGQASSMREMVAALSDYRAVVVSESHDRFDHHLNQLAIIKSLHAADPRLAIGMEQFEQPFQNHLDDFVRGGIDTASMLLATEYFDRWTFDYRLYDPILAFAREQRIPVIALKPDRHLTSRFVAGGAGALTAAERELIPELDRSDKAYEERLRAVFDAHPASKHGRQIDDFVTTQLLWDEGMADRAARYLQDNPERRMVVLAGRGHADYGSGIPNRLARRLGEEVATVTHAAGDDDAARADFVLQSKPVELPDKGLLGVMVESSEGGVLVRELVEGGAAGAVGVEPGDVITAIDQQPVTSLSDLRVRLWDKSPGDRVMFTVNRGSDALLTQSVVLR